MPESKINSTCSTAPACSAASCHWRCALEVIDELLRVSGAASADETDHLLELRWQLRQRVDAERTLQLFCDLRRRMEPRHYLAFFRVRRWLENHLVARVSVGQGTELHFVPVKLDHYCVEAVRRVCLCATLEHGAGVTRIHFDFRNLAPNTARRSPVAASID